MFDLCEQDLVIIAYSLFYFFDYYVYCISYSGGSKKYQQIWPPDQWKCETHFQDKLVSSQTTVVLVWGFGRAGLDSLFGCVLPARLASFCQILGAKFKRASELAVVKAACLLRRETMAVQCAAPAGEEGRLLVRRGNISGPDIWLCAEGAPLFPKRSSLLPLIE